MWKTKTFKTLAAMQAWISHNCHRYEWQEIAVNNAYGILYRRLRAIY
jgi:hypothetical protein